VPSPLSHIKVLDLSRVMAGPWAGQLLADLGADVIKVERPGVGDDTRTWGPPFLPTSDGTQSRESGYYLSVNRGKRSLTINIDKPQGQEIVRVLAAVGHSVGELQGRNACPLRPRLYDLAGQPALIYCSVSDSTTGPKAQKACLYDFLIQAMGGLMSITAKPTIAGGGPQKVGIPILDLMTGMYTTVAVLAALAGREQSGEGDYIDVAMLDVQTAVLANQAMNYLMSGRTPRRQGNRHPNIMPQDVFRCRDGDVVIAVGNDGQFAKMCQAVGRPDVGSDPRFARNSDRVRHKDELMPLIAGIVADWSRADLVAAMERAGVPCGPINSIAEVFDDPQIKHRGMRIDLPHPSAGHVPLVGSPLKFGRAEPAYARAPPLLGQHSDEVLHELGFTDGEIAKLRHEGVV
jgi:crotonobetainyl-CoA:carnitine CoA-transferase CaiB-like acyl-CoA transferase